MPPILAIDDSPDDVFLFRQLLKEADSRSPLLTFTRATDAVSYLIETAEANHPSRVPFIIFTDLRMPEMDGFEFLARIRKERLFNDVPVIVLSSSDDPRNVEKAEQLGAARFFVKFPSKDELLSVLEGAGAQQ